MRMPSRRTGVARGRPLALLIPLIAIPLVAAPAVAQDTDDLTSVLMTRERSLWDAWRDHDWDVFRSHIAENAVSMSASGPLMGRDMALETMENDPCEVRSYSLGDARVVQVAPGTAVVVYRAEQDATCGGQAVPGQVWATSVWVQSGGEWRNVLHQEVPVEGNGS